ncbi:MAG: DUF1211 domain-containing protein [Rhizobiales bacterium]|nr:DUF1211 domain-containing protein [Hyphomicrobiales bacterium]
MGKGRLEAFSDGVIAIIITIMVLELKVPRSEDLSALAELWPVFLSYILSFAYVGIYWNNHHHMLHAVKKANGAMLLANLHLLFWLSLFPFTTGWVGENHFSKWPVFVYGLNLLLAAVAYTILVRTIIAFEGKDSLLARAIGADWKGNISMALYAAGMAMTFVSPPIGFALYACVVVMWFVPDRRIERRLAD